MKITSYEIIDLRVPTSDKLLGSDPFHKKPDYSSAVLHLFATKSGTGNSSDDSAKQQGEIKGISIVFTVGAGTDWICYGIKDLCENLILGVDIESEFIKSPIKLYKRLIDHHQLRWLHDGVFRMAVGAVMNAMWDIWAKMEKKPLWKLLTDLEPEFIVNECIDWRNITDALTRDEALCILKGCHSNVGKREKDLKLKGPKAYCTAGWTGLSNDEILETVSKLQKNGFDSFKLKVGLDVQKDVERIRFMRDAIGRDCNLMVDANQYWGNITEATKHMDEYCHNEYNLKWVEEPIARDDVLGYVELSKIYRNKRATFGLACGEQAASPVIFKQLLKNDAIQYCQIDAVRVGGVNDVMAIILMAAKYNVPVCPHGGGIALCNMIQHYSIWDQIAVSGHSHTQYCEYIDFLQDVLVYPVETKDGHYVTPETPGWGLELLADFLSKHTYPNGVMWNERDSTKKGAKFEV